MCIDAIANLRSFFCKKFSWDFLNETCNDDDDDSAVFLTLASKADKDTKLISPKQHQQDHDKLDDDDDEDTQQVANMFGQKMQILDQSKNGKGKNVFLL